MTISITNQHTKASVRGFAGKAECITCWKKLFDKGAGLLDKINKKKCHLSGL